MYITAILTHLVVKLHKNKNLRCLFKATADGSMPEFSELDFCDGFEMKFTSPLGGIQ